MKPTQLSFPEVGCIDDQEENNLATKMRFCFMVESVFQEYFLAT
jgi:hypothetical protein